MIGFIDLLRYFSLSFFDQVVGSDSANTLNSVYFWENLALIVYYLVFLLLIILVGVLVASSLDENEQKQLIKESKPKLMSIFLIILGWLFWYVMLLIFWNILLELAPSSGDILSASLYSLVTYPQSAVFGSIPPLITVSTFAPMLLTELLVILYRFIPYALSIVFALLHHHRQEPDSSIQQISILKPSSVVGGIMALFFMLVMAFQGIIFYLFTPANATGEYLNSSTPVILRDVDTLISSGFALLSMIVVGVLAVKIFDFSQQERLLRSRSAAIQAILVSSTVIFVLFSVFSMVSMKLYLAGGYPAELFGLFYGNLGYLTLAEGLEFFVTGKTGFYIIFTLIVIFLSSVVTSLLFWCFVFLSFIRARSNPAPEVVGTTKGDDGTIKSGKSVSSTA